MNPPTRLSRRVRWLAPVGAVAAVGLAIAGSALAGAQSSAPLLPARSTAQLLAAVDGPAAPPPPMTATVQEIANLGLPSLPGSDSPLSAMSLLSGTHTFNVWYGGPTRVRVAMPVALGETDVRRLGRDVWLWNSKTSQATHYVLPAAAANAPQLPAKTPNVPTPQQLAKQILAAVGKTTTVKLQQNVTVAGQSAYQLSLAPKDSSSLIGQITIAVDASNSCRCRCRCSPAAPAAPRSSWASPRSRSACPPRPTSPSPRHRARRSGRSRPTGRCCPACSARSGCPARSASVYRPACRAGPRSSARAPRARRLWCSTARTPRRL